MQTQHCINCYYSRPNSPEVISCHRYPPTITKAVGTKVTSYFPLLTNSAWCGEWRKRAIDTYESETDSTISSETKGDGSNAQ